MRAFAAHGFAITGSGSLLCPVSEPDPVLSSIFEGPGEKLNLLPMNGNLNKGAWKAMENEWSVALKEGKSVNVKIEPVYSGGGTRPDGFNVEYSINGSRPKEISFKNTPGGT